jgi:hypothetical protein
LPLMKTATKSLLLAAIVFYSTLAAVAQPVRLWSYASYSVHNFTGAIQLFDTGQFYYSGSQELTFDSTLEYFFYRVPTTFNMHTVPDDYPNLNLWYTHRYQTIAPRVVAQFDSFNSWQYTGTSPPTFELKYSTKKMYTGSGRLDSMRITHHNGPSPTTWSSKFTYDQSGRPDTWRVAPSDTITLTRDSAGRVIRKDGEYLGSVEPVISFYRYNTQGLADTVTVFYNNNGNIALIRRDVLEYDALGRLRTVRMPGPYAHTFVMYADLDSFVYDGTSNRCTDIYQFFYGNTSMNQHHTYTYDVAGRMISYSRGNNLFRTFQRNAAGLITEMTETSPPTVRTGKTYYYYDSLGATGVGSVKSTPPFIEIYPNPTTGFLTITYTGGGTVELIDMPGRLQRTIALPEGKGHISTDVSDLVAGTYTYRRIESGLATQVGKLLIVK